ncbi:MAG: DUF1553 domain-containing protein, partial [Verrucomicrobiales bacterium]|nr:DUF1553 domain-containing protein [Verrucomicrobiales bacterium]
AWTDAASRGYEMLIEDGRLKWSLIHFWPGNAASVKATAELPTGEWVHVVVSSDGSGRADGLKIYVGGEPAPTEVVRDALTKQIRGGGGDHISIGERMRDRGFKGGLVDDFRVVGREVSALEAGKLAAGELLGGEMGEVYAAHLEGLKGLREERAKSIDGVTEIMAMKEMEVPKKAFVLERGMYDARGEEVEMAVPGFLPPLPEGAPVNRLGLAKWLTDVSHPLFARTAVNRFWAACFGRGLVKTAEDFGAQGERPEYRELVDWLAGDFMGSGWDVKRLMRTIVMSATYRQRSVGEERLMQDDPENRLLARGPRHRLSAEMIRDNALAASGLLVEKIGGAPVRPYEVAESFKPVKVDAGDGRYRRSLYTYWKQTAPAPGMMAFDAVKRDVCVARRERSNTPLQALILLNGEQYVEAARVLGEKLWKESGGDVRKMTERAFVRLTSRKPVADELAVVGRMFEEQREVNGGDAVKAAGEVVLALMSFDECVVKR